MAKPQTLIPHTIKSTGKTVFLRRVSIATLMMDLMQQNPKPLPPLQEVELAGQKTLERNYAHPDYPAAIAAWEQDIETKIMMILLSGYIQVELTDEDKKEVAEYRANMEGIRSLNQNDKQVWLRSIAISTDEDLRDIMAALRSGGQPTEEGIKNAADGFPGNAK